MTLIKVKAAVGQLVEINVNGRLRVCEVIAVHDKREGYGDHCVEVRVGNRPMTSFVKPSAIAALALSAPKKALARKGSKPAASTKT